MLIFLYGPDDYRRKGKERFYLAEFKKKHSHLGVGKFDLAAEGVFESFQEFVRSQSLFEPVKLVFLENCEEVTESMHKTLTQELKPFTEHKETTIILSFIKKPVAAFASLMKKAFAVEAFEHLAGHEWEMFVRREAKNQNVKLADDAVRFLSEAYQGDTWRLVTELQKLASLERPTIDRKELEKFDIEIAPNFWELLNGLKSGNIKNRLAALEQMFVEGEPAGKIFNVVAYQLPGKLSEMARYDVLVKSGKMDYEEALLDLALS